MPNPASGIASLVLLVCFGGALTDKLAPATPINGTVLQCTVPSQISHSAYLEVSVNQNAAPSSSGSTFDFYSQPRVSRLSVDSGPVSGGTVVTVYGINFAKVTTCKFGPYFTSGQTISNNKIRCISPAHAVGSVYVEISNNGLDYTSDETVFSYRAIATVTSVSPQALPFNTGTILTVLGANFVQSRILCRLDTVVVTGTFVNSTMVLCEINWIRRGRPATVRLSFNGIDFSQGNPVIVSRATPVQITLVRPAILSSTGSLIAVSGYGFVADENSHCVFAENIEVQAQVVNSSYLQCVSPPLFSSHGPHVPLQILSKSDLSMSEKFPMILVDTVYIIGISPRQGPSSGSTSITISGANFFKSSLLTVRFGSAWVSARALSSTTLVCISPAHASGTVTVDVSNNAQDFSTSDQTFQYYTAPSISALLPAFGSSYGGTVVSVFGDGFVDSSRLTCRFGVRTSVAVFVNATLLLCSSPSQGDPTIDASVNVSVSNNDIDYSGAFPFKFRCKNVVVNGVSPSSGPWGEPISIQLFAQQYYLNGGGYRCMFDQELVLATLVNSTTLICQLPKSTNIGLPSRVIASDNLWDFSISSVEFLFFSNPVLYQLSPVFVSGSGTPNFIIHGSGFSRVSNLLCKFNGTAISNATWLSSSLITCPVPAMSLTSKPVSVDVSVNGGGHFTSSGLTIFVENVPQLTYLSPLNGTTGTHITVNGLGFRSSPEAVCRFDFTSGNLRFVNSNQVICKFPEMTSTSIAVSVSNNGVDVSNSLLFTVRAPSSIATVYPNQISVSGNRTIEISGFGFVPSITQCVFNSTLWVSAIYANSTFLLCSVPLTFSPGRFRIGTGENLQQLSSKTVLVEIIDDIILDARSLSVSSGPTSGNTVVTVLGANFKRHVTCVFGIVPVIGSFLNSETAVCVSPAHLVGTVMFGISNNVRDFTIAPNRFTFFTPATVLSILPSFGQPGGNTVVSVTGTNFILSGLLICKFGSYRIAATFIDSTMLTCPSPPGFDNSTISFAVSNNGQDYTNALPFTFSDNPSLTSCIPNSAAIGGQGVNVNVSGNGFINSTLLKCAFGPFSSSAKFHTSGLLQCQVPVEATGSAKLYLLRVTNNNADFSATGLDFQISSAPIITRIWRPLSVPVGALSEVTIIGDFFFNSDLLTCHFDKYLQSIHARFIDSKTLICAVPSLPSTFTNISIRISNNGVEMTSSVIVGVHPMPVVLSVNPAVVSVSQSVTVIGTHFSYSNLTACVYNSKDIVPAEYLNSTAIVCSSPSVFTSDTISVSIRNAYGEWSPTSSSFSLVRRPSISAISPQNGIPTGGTIVTVTGTGFVNNRLVCRFNDSSSAVSIVSGVFFTSTMITCVAPAGALGVARIDVSFYDLDFTPALLSTYTYSAAAEFQSCYPSRLTTAGGTWIKVLGYQFINSPHLCARIGNEIYRAIFISEKLLTFKSKAHVAGSSVLDVSNNCQEFSRENFTLHYDSPFIVNSFIPRNVSTVGGTMVSIVGSGFYSTISAACYFGNIFVEAQVLNSTIAICRAPPHGSAELDLSFSVSDVEPSVRLPYKIRYVANAVFTSIIPTFGPSSGSPSVFILGSGLEFTSHIRIRVGARPDDVIVSVKMLNSTALSFSLPAILVGKGTRKFHIYISDFADPSLFRPSGLTFKVFAKQRLSYIVPPFGVTSGNTSVSLFGYGFVHSRFMSVRFGNTTVKPVFVSSIQMDMLTPPSLISGPVPVQFSQNEIDFAEDIVYFTYLHPPTIYSLVDKILIEKVPAEITVLGSNFSRSGSLACLFGSVALPGAFYNASQVICPTPRLSTQSSTLSLVYGTDKFLLPYSIQIFPSNFITSVVLISVSDSNEYSFGIAGTFGNFSQSPYCSIDDNIIISKIYSSNYIVCNISNPRIGQLRFSIGSATLEPRLQGDSTLRFEVFMRPNVTKIIPTVGPVMGNTSVSVFGENFANSIYIKCLFGNISVNARFVNSSVVICRSPHRANPLNATVRVSNDGYAFSIDKWSSVFSQVSNLPSLLSVAPSIAPERGGTHILISGSGFMQSDTLTCFFGSTAITSSFINSTTSMCLSPAISTTSMDTLQIHLNRDSNVSISVPFSVVLDAQIFEVYPSFGSVLGGTVITLRGQGFYSPYPASCSIGVSVVSATIISSSKAICVTAPNEPGSVQIQISNIPSGYSSSSVQFSFVAIPVVSHTIPAFVESDIKSGAMITLIGSGFGNHSSVFGNLGCAFIGTTFNFTANALYVSTNEIRCPIPQAKSDWSAIAGVFIPENGTPIPGPSIPFHFLPTMSILQVYPSSVVEGSKSFPISISGDGFQPIGNVFCTFSNSYSLAVFANNTLVVCLLPPFSTAFPEIAIQFADDIRSSSTIYLPVVKMPKIDSISQSSLPNATSQSITVTGSFSNIDLMMCKLGSVNLRMQRISATSVLCSTANELLFPGVYPLTIDHTIFGNSSVYSFPFSVFFDGVAVSTHIPSPNGVVEVAGVLLKNHPALTCKFEYRYFSFEVSAIWVNSSLVKCGIPLDAIGLFNVSIQSTSSQYLHAPIASSLVGPQFASIVSISPSSVYADGFPKQFTVFGTGFISTMDLKIKVGAITLDAGFLNSTAISFTLPTAVEPVGNFAVKVLSDNGFLGDVNLSMLEIPNLLQVVPSSGSLFFQNSVTLIGTGFTTTTIVKIGTITLNHNLISQTEMVATIPNGTFSQAGSHIVSVSQPEVTQVTSTNVTFQFLNIAINSIHPVAISQTSNSPVITIGGNSFPSSASYHCILDGSHAFQAILLSSSNISCKIDASLLTGNRNISVEVGTGLAIAPVAVSTSSLFLEVIDRIYILDLSLSTVAISTSTLLEARGRFNSLTRPLGLVSCHFGSTVTFQAISFNASVVICPIAMFSNSFFPATFSISTSVCGVKLVSNQVTSPKIIPELAGASSSIVTGANDIAISLYNPISDNNIKLCRYTQTDNRTNRITSTLSCTSSQNCTCPAPVYRSGSRFILEISSNNGLQSFSPSSTIVKIFDAPVVASVEFVYTNPLTLILHGSGFANASPIRCLFDDGAIVAPAIFVSASTIFCKVDVAPGIYAPYSKLSVGGGAPFFFLLPNRTSASLSNTGQFRSLQNSSVITFSGSYLMTSPTYCLVPSVLPIPAMAVNMSLGICALPSMMSGSVSVVVAVQGSSNSLSENAVVSLVDPPQVFSISPESGPEFTQTVISVQGTGFTPTSKCLINSTLLAATSVSSSTVAVCTLSSVYGRGKVTIGIIDQRTSPSYAVFSFISLPNLSPSNSPLQIGRYATITSLDFPGNQPAICMLGSTITGRAAIASQNTFLCPLPTAAESLSDKDLLSLSFDDGLHFVPFRQWNATYIHSQSLPSVASVAPVMSSVDQPFQLVVMLSAAFRFPVTNIACKFGDNTKTPASFFNHTTIVCGTVLLKQQASVTLLIDDIVTLDSSFFVQVSRPSIIDTIHPTVGLASASTSISIFGTRFASNSMCRFGGNSSLVSIPSKIADRAIICNLPNTINAQTTKMLVEVSDGTGAYSTATTLLELFDSNPIIASVSPNAFYLDDFPQFLSVVGLNFYSSSTLQCALTCAGSGALVFQADFVSSTLVYCYAAGFICRSQLAGLSVSNDNGTNYSPTFYLNLNQKPLFASVSSSSVASLSPSYITVNGANFSQTSTCILNGTAVVPIFKYISTSSVECIIPSHLFPSRNNVSVAVITDPLLSFKLQRSFTLSLRYQSYITEIVPHYAVVGAIESVMITILGNGFSQPWHTTLVNGFAVPPSQLKVINSSAMSVYITPSLRSGSRNLTIQVSEAPEFNGVFEAIPPVVLSTVGSNASFGGSRIIMGASPEVSSQGVIWCRFTGYTTSFLQSVATVINSSMISCLLPPASNGNETYIRIGLVLDDSVYSQNFITIPITSSVFISRVAVSQTKATMLIKGSGFAASPPFVCLIRGQSNSFTSNVATILNDFSASCPVDPPFGFETASLDVELIGNGGVSLYKTMPTFSAPPASAIRVHPSSIVAHSSTPLVIDFLIQQSGSSFCYFGSQSVPIAISSTKLSGVCLSPANISSSTVRFRVVSGFVSLLDVNMTVLPVPSVFYSIPSSPISCLSLVDLLFVGSGFNSALQFTCRYRSTTTPTQSIDMVGTVVNETSVQCPIVSCSEFGSSTVSLYCSEQMIYNSSIIQLPRESTHIVDTLLGAQLTSDHSFIVLGKLFSGTIQCEWHATAPLAAVIINSSAIRCPAPPSLLPNASLRLLNSDGTILAPGFIKLPVLAKLPSLLAVSPTSGPTQGGTVINLSGRLLSAIAPNSRYCQFRLDLNSAPFSTSTLQVLSNTLSICTTPSSAAGTVYLSVTNYLAPILFRFYPNIVLTNVEPSLAAFNATVFIAGVNFINTPQLSCFFSNTLSSKLTFVNSTLIACRVPVNTDIVGAGSISVSNNGVDKSSNSLTFTVTKSPVSVLSIYPTRAPSSLSRLNSFNLTVSGNGFVQSSTICRFDLVTSIASVFNSSVLTCPIMDGAEPITRFYISNDNGVTFVDSTLSISRYSSYSLDVFPWVSSSTGGAEVIISGQDFVADDQYYFGSIKASNCSRASPSRTVCLAPVHVAGKVEITLRSASNEILASTGTVFSFVDPPALSRMLQVSATSGDEITLVLSSPVHPFNASCRFANSVVVAAVVSSSNMVRCLVPELVPGNVTVELSLNSEIYSDPVYLAVKPYLMQVEGISPSWGSAVGGYNITINAFYAGNRDYAVGCLFSDSISSTLSSAYNHTSLFGGRVSILCTVPSVTYDVVVTVQLVLSDGFGSIWVHPTKMGFTYSDSGILWITPDSMISDSNRSVTLLIDGFSPRLDNSACLFERNGQTQTSAVVAMSSDSAFCLLPGGAVAGDYSVGIRFSNNNIGSKFASLQLRNRPIIWKIFPETGTSAGGENVYLEGTGFALSLTATCRFLLSSGQFHSDVAAWPVSPTLLTCQRPSLPEGLYTVYVSNDAVEFSVQQNISFTTIADINLLDVKPIHGPMSGGTTLSVSGSGFINSSSLLCAFLNSNAAPFYSETTFLSTSLLTCTTPAVFEQSSSFYNVSLSIILSGSNIFPTRFIFHYDRQPVIATILPNLFYRNIAGRQMVITGGQFLSKVLDIASTVCRFNASISVNASSIAENEIICPCPLGVASGAYDLEISFNGQQYWNTGHRIFWTHEPLIQSIDPKTGPVTGLTPIFVTTQAFINTDTNSQIICNFGDEQLVHGIIQNLTTLLCISPIVGQSGPVKLSLYYSNTGPHPYAEDIYFSFYPAVSSLNLYPESSLISSWASVFVRGPSVFGANRTQCVVSETSTVLPTLFLSTDLLLCQIPPGISFPFSLQNSGIHISLTDAPLELLPFKFLVKCPQGSFCIGGAKFKCPAGAFCPATRPNSNFTVCSPGFYQPEGGQSRCLACPAPFICPDYGTRIPTGCPVGFICDVAGQSSPTSLCPEGHTCDISTLTSNLGNVSPLNYTVGNLQLQGRFKSAFPLLPSDIKSKFPIPCQNGTYCVIGSPINTGIICNLGAMCGEGESRPEGSETPPGWYSPSTGLDIFLCPLGHFCPGRGNAVPIPCPRGSYSDIFGKAVCSLCPQGYVCPSSGMTIPLACPPGLLCQSYGQQDESQECPAGFFCQNGIPQPCPAGSYCLEGVGFSQVQLWNFTHAQGCMAGTWCLEGSPDVYGSGFCPPGSYCPSNSSSPIVIVPGQYSSTIAKFRPMDCPPGRFSAQIGATNCLTCPSGYSCSAFRMVRPIVCPRGYYRTQAEGITCEPCTPGTWSNTLGLVDQSLCDPCPSGKVCGLIGMWNLEQATLCVEGYVCGQRTHPAIQFDIKCPSGYACPAATTIESKYEYLCPAGYICVEGTPYSLRNLYRCPLNRYCPRGTYRKLKSTNTTSGPGLVYESLPGRSNDSRPGDDTTVWDKFWTVCRPSDIASDSSDPNEDCDFFTVYTPLPNGIINIRYSQVCPLGTQSLERSQHIEDCTVIPDFGPATEFSPVNLNRIGSGISTYVRAPVDYWFQDIEPLDVIVADFNFASTPLNITYSVHWQLSFYTDGQEGTRRRLPVSFESALTSKHDDVQLSVIARVPISFTWRIEIIHGISLWAAMSFVNITNLTRTRPNRAVLGTKDTFVSVLSKSLELELPLNLPRSDESDLFVTFTTSKPTIVAPLQSDNTSTDLSSEVPLINDDFADVFVSSTEANDYYADPFMPYISNCRGFDSYLYFFQLFESHNCSLISESDTQPVGALNFGQNPVADFCYNVYECSYEEILSSVGILDRWYMASTPTPTFYITSSPVTYEQILQGPVALAEALSNDIGSDSLIPVMASSLDSNSDKTQVPRLVRFEVEYQQVDARRKKIITASLYFDQFDVDKFTTNYTYQFEAVLRPLGYTELVNRFAFDFVVYFTLFIGIGTVMCACVVVYWSLHKLLSRVKFKSTFKLWDFLMLSESKPLIGIALFSAPIFIILAIIDFVLITMDAFGSYSGSFANFATPSYVEAKTYRGGRLAVAFLTLGFHGICLGSQLFIPKKVMVRRVRSIEMNGDRHEQFEAAVNAAESEPIDRTWHPRLWKRFHFVSSCLFVSCILVFMIEYSYSVMFSTYTVEIIILLKLVSPIIQFSMKSLVKEQLLMAPLQAAYGATTFVMTMGAPDLTGFVTGFVTDTVFDVLDCMYISPSRDLISETLSKAYQKGVKYINRQLRIRAARKESDRRRKLGYAPATKDLEEGSGEDDQHEEENDDEEEEVLEPVIEAFNDHATSMIGATFCPLVLLMMIVFRQELQIPITYGIREADMVYYLVFAIIILPYTILFNAFIINILELFHGFKIYSYLKYCQFKFLTREMRWQACETQMDMGIDPSIRSIHQFSFSEQYSFSTILTTMGMIFVTLGSEAMVRHSYNMFGDPLTPAIMLLSLLLQMTIVKISCSVADMFGLWRIRNRFQTNKNESAKKKVKITDWEEIEHMAALAKIQLQNDMKRIETPRLLDDSFRSDFVKFNRTWLVLQLEQIVSPRNVRRDRSRALAQLGRVLLTTKGEEGAVAEVSSDSSSGDEFAQQMKEFRYAKVPQICQTVGTGWLAVARWRIKLRSMYEEITQTWLDLHGRKCSRCESTDNVLTESEPNIDHLVNRYHHMEEVTTVHAVDALKWKNYLDARAEFSAMCKRCIDEQEELKDALTKLSGVTRKIAVMWLQTIRQILKKRKQETALRENTQYLSDDGDSDDDVETTVRDAAKSITVSSISEQIYQQWLNLVRLKIVDYRRSAVAESMPAAVSATATIEESSSESDYEYAGLDAGNKNVVGPVSDLTDQLITFWMNDARLAIYCRKQEVIETQRFDHEPDKGLEDDKLKRQ